MWLGWGWCSCINSYLFTIIPGVAQSVKCPPHTHEDVNLIFRTHIKMPDVVAHICIPVLGETGNLA